jgi:hypothetical protein
MGDWQAYVDSNLMCVVDAEGNTLKCAALVGKDDNSVWAKSADFPDFTEAEVRGPSKQCRTCCCSRAVPNLLARDAQICCHVCIQPRIASGNQGIAEWLL